MWHLENLYSPKNPIYKQYVAFSNGSDYIVICWRDLTHIGKRIIYTKIEESVILSGEIIPTHAGQWDPYPVDKTAIFSKYNITDPDN